MSSAKLHNIYLVDKRKCTQLPETKICEPEGIEHFLKKIFTEERNDNHIAYGEQILTENVLTAAKEKGFHLTLLYKREEKISVLSQFFNTIAQNGEPILADTSGSGSSILIIRDEANVFLIPTGQAYHHIKPYIINDFGIRFASLFKEDITIGAISQNELGGNVHTSSLVFCSEIPLAALPTTNSIAKNCHGHLGNTELTDKLLPAANETAAAQRNKFPKIAIKTYLQFGRQLPFDRLLEHLKKLVDYAEERIHTRDLCMLRDNINLITCLDHEDANYDTCLTKLTEQLWAQQNSFCIMPQDALKYKEAETYDIHTNTSDGKPAEERPREIDEAYIINQFSSFADLPKDISVDDLTRCRKDYIRKSNIDAYRGNEILTSGSILSHLSGDIPGYFVINGEFYPVIEEQKKFLLRTTEKLFDKADPAEDFLGIDWKAFATQKDTKGNLKFDEDEFNVAVCKNNTQKDAQFYFFHKIFPQYIEFADIIKFAGNDAYIIHVKDGLNHSMRALCRQVDISIQQYKSFKANRDSRYIHALYTSAVPVAQKNFNDSFKSAFPRYKDFQRKLIDSEVTYVMAIHPHNAVINNTKSITALYCLEQTRQLCLRQNIKLKIVII